MSRRYFSFPCEGATLVATLDHVPGKIGLLIVTGGNETRAGAFSGQTNLAARIAQAGFSVLRFDRRGVGDSTGDNASFLASTKDITAALAAFRAEHGGLERVVGFGNCDAASALMLAEGAGCDGLVLANPWTFDAGDAEDLAPASAIRSRYAAKLRNPREVWRLVTGGVSISKLARGLKKAMSPPQPPSSLLTTMQDGIAKSGLQPGYLLAANDRTAQAFMAAWPGSSADWMVCENAGHSFAEPDARDWLFNQLLAVLHEQARQLDVG